MAVVNPHVHTEQEILNSSFDETTGVLIVESGLYDPSGSVLREVSPDLATKVTVSGLVTYVAQATPGSAQSSAVWRAKKIDETTGVVVTWAGGNTSFTNIATDLTSLTYT